jgi:hypothetical protein
VVDWQKIVGKLWLLILASLIEQIAFTLIQKINGDPRRAYWRQYAGDIAEIQISAEFDRDFW